MASLNLETSIRIEMSARMSDAALHEHMESLLGQINVALQQLATASWNRACMASWDETVPVELSISKIETEPPNQ